MPSVVEDSPRPRRTGTAAIGAAVLAIAVAVAVLVATGAGKLAVTIYALTVYGVGAAVIIRLPAARDRRQRRRHGAMTAAALLIALAAPLAIAGHPGPAAFVAACVVVGAAGALRDRDDARAPDGRGGGDT